tara:strand:- start:719 stop:952 length:234 start_codon:yes stop_codon:yes gene_type:complete
MMTNSSRQFLQQQDANNSTPELPPSENEAPCCEQVRELAYEKWEAAGCPCCDGTDFWLQAEAELNGNTSSGSISKNK